MIFRRARAVFWMLSSAVPVLAMAETTTAPAAGGIVAAVRGDVRVERGGGELAAAPGMRLLEGDRIEAGQEGEAVVYVGGESVLRVASGGRLSLDGDVSRHADDRVRRVAATTTRRAETGLDGLVGPSSSETWATRRAEDAELWRKATAAFPAPLSPRFETVVDLAPTFIAFGGARPVRIALATGTSIIWRSGSLEGEGPWTPEAFPRLDPKREFLWRIESQSDGTPLSEWVPFQAVSERVLLETHNLEVEMRRLAEEPMGAAAADLIRCGYYADLGSWTPLLAAASRLLAAQPDSEIARSARERAVAGLGLDDARLAALERSLASRSPL